MSTELGNAIAELEEAGKLLKEVNPPPWAEPTWCTWKEQVQTLCEVLQAQRDLPAPSQHSEGGHLDAAILWAVTRALHGCRPHLSKLGRIPFTSSSLTPELKAILDDVSGCFHTIQSALEESDPIATIKDWISEVTAATASPSVRINHFHVGDDGPVHFPFGASAAVAYFINELVRAARSSYGLLRLNIRTTLDGYTSPPPPPLLVDLRVFGVANLAQLKASLQPSKDDIATITPIYVRILALRRLSTVRESARAQELRVLITLPMRG